MGSLNFASSYTVTLGLFTTQDRAKRYTREVQPPGIKMHKALLPEDETVGLNGLWRCYGIQKTLGLSLA